MNGALPRAIIVTDARDAAPGWHLDAKLDTLQATGTGNENFKLTGTDSDTTRNTYLYLGKGAAGTCAETADTIAYVGTPTVPAATSTILPGGFSRTTSIFNKTNVDNVTGSPTFTGTAPTFDNGAVLAANATGSTEIISAAAGQGSRSWAFDFTSPTSATLHVPVTSQSDKTYVGALNWTLGEAPH